MWALSSLTFILLVYLIGDLYYRDNLVQRFSAKLSVGFFLMLGLFEIISLPFMFFHVNYYYVYYLCVAMIGGIIFFWIKAFKNQKKKFYFFRPDIWIIIAACIILAQILAYIIFTISDADDSFYLSIMSDAILGKPILSYDTTTGIKSFGFQETYSLGGYELLLSFFCRTFKINPAAFCHTYLPLVLIIIQYCVIYEFICFLSEKNRTLLLCIFAFFNCMGGYSTYSRAYFFATRLWQGKGVYVCIVLPFLMLQLLKMIYIDKFDKKYLFLLCVIIYASYATTAVAIYLTPFFYFALAITVCILNRKKLCLEMLVIPGIVSIPFVFLKFILLHRNYYIVTRLEGAISGNDYWYLLKRSNGEGIYYIIYLIALFIVMIWGKEKVKNFFWLIPIVELATFINPLFCDWIGNNLTGVATYWRIFWLIPIDVTFLYAVECMFEKVSKKYLVLLPTFIITLLVGRFAYIGDKFKMAENPEKLHDSTIKIADILPKGSAILLPEEYYCELRQYTGDILLTWSRYMDVNYNLNGEQQKFEDLLSALSGIYEDNDYDCIKVIKDELPMDYIGVYTNSVTDYLKFRYDQIYSDNDITVFCIAQ
ncbi:MAG: DUF6077 domain-containing protein [Butyrivibrio hungatei]|nr:DUF6077 domain-containing protein [Butyrivibrio hungatei]